MMIEFIGSTGAGKTTLFAAVQRRLAGTTGVTTAFDLLAAPLGLRGVTHPTARNLIQEAAGLPFLLASLPRHRPVLAFTLRMLARQAGFSVFTLNNLRSLARKIGVYEFGRRYGRDRIILVDEGTVLLAHNLFVYSSASYTAEEITRFAALTPLPDLIVYVRAPVETLIGRALRRTDPPREMRSKDRAQIETYVGRAAALFEQLVKTEPIRGRVLIVENPESDESDQRAGEAAVDCITGFIYRSIRAAK
jgi:thymidylate kinase